jgi:hypothetical protein
VVASLRRAAGGAGGEEGGGVTMIDPVALLAALRAERTAVERELARLRPEIAAILAWGRLLAWVAPCGLAGCHEARGPF